MITVGLTGGIGSGKSTVASVWERLGAKIVLADNLAKDLMQNDELLKSKIKAAFGEAAYDENGKLDRKYLANEAFKKGRVEELNQLVHPVVYAWFRHQKESEEKKGTVMLVREAALLLDKGRPTDVDVIVVVDAPVQTRKERVVERDKTEEEEVQRRMDKQLHPQKMRGMADFIIENTGDIEQLENKSTQVFNELLKWNLE